MTVISDIWDLVDTLESILENAKRRDEHQFDGDDSRRYRQQDLNGFTEAYIHLKDVRQSLQQALQSQSEDGVSGAVSDAIQSYYRVQDSLRKDSTGAFLDGLIVGGKVYEQLVEISKKVEVDHRRR